MAAWGSDVPEDLELNEEALANALKKVRMRLEFFSCQYVSMSWRHI